MGIPDNYNMLTEMGINIPSPLAQCVISYTQDDYKHTWAEKQRDKLIYRLRLRKAWLNRIVASIVVLTLIYISLYITAFIAERAQTEWNQTIAGLLGAELLIMSCMSYGLFNTSPWDVRIKRDKY